MNQQPAECQAAIDAENRFETLWRALGGPELEHEFRFHPTRVWRRTNETQRCRGRRGKRGEINRLSERKINSNLVSSGTALSPGSTTCASWRRPWKTWLGRLAPGRSRGVSPREFHAPGQPNAGSLTRSRIICSGLGEINH